MAFFQTAMYKAMYERKFNASSEAASDADLEQFMYQYAVAPVCAIALTRLSQGSSAQAYAFSPVK